MTSPRTAVWSSGTTRLALGVPPLSIRSQLYQPARPPPICAIHGQTCSGGALIVMAWVDVKIAVGHHPVGRKRTMPFDSGRKAGSERHNTMDAAFAVPATRRGRRA